MGHHSGIGLFVVATHLCFFLSIHFTTGGSKRIAALFVGDVDCFVEDDGRQQIIFPGRAEEMNEIAFKAVVLEGFGEITWSLLLRSFKKIIDYLIVLNKTNIEVRFYYH